MASSALAPRQGARRSGFSRDRGAPGAGDRERLVAAGPGRHGDGEERERRSRLGAELEMGSQGNRQAEAGRGVDDALRFARTPPYPPAPRKDPPDLLDGAMGDGVRNLAGRQLEMGKTTAGKRERQVHSGAVGRG